MRKLHSLLAPLPVLALLGPAACGDGRAHPDGQDPGDADQPGEPPQLGKQIDRMGRPAINTLLDGLRDMTDVATLKKDAYNAVTDPAGWGMAPVVSGRSIAAELAANLALLDVLDQGNGTIPGPVGCKNQILYNGNPRGGGTTGSTSYDTLAGLLADDMLYVDTTKSTCNMYLSIEIDVGTAGQIQHMHCGGRAPTHDVIDVSYSLLIAGLNGFTVQPGLIPLISDGVAVHADVSDATFPFFGAPH